MFHRTLVSSIPVSLGLLVLLPQCYLMILNAFHTPAGKMKSFFSTGEVSVSNEVR